LKNGIAIDLLELMMPILLTIRYPA